MKLIVSTIEILKALGLPDGIEIEVSDNEISDDEGWISNIGYDEYWHPVGLHPHTMIEIRCRNGCIKKGYAGFWQIFWRETDGHSHDIIAYRVIS
jgi:hypothetical protein